jgi:hypothetical protein
VTPDARRALRDAVLAVLREHYPVPVSSFQLLDELASSEWPEGRYSEVGTAAYRCLHALTTRRDPVAVPLKFEGERVAYWVLTSPPATMPEPLQELDRSLRDGS